MGLPASLLLLLSGCGGKAYDTCDGCGETIICCFTTATAEYPADGADDVYYRAVIEFSLSEADSSASVSLTDASGAEVAGASSLNDDNDGVYFTPAEPLTPSSAYTATLRWCGSTTGGASIRFTTSAIGEPLTSDIAGNTYLVDLASGRFIEPPGVGDLVGDLLEQGLLLGVVSAGSTLDLRFAVSMAGGTDQDTCSQTLEELPDADFSQSPYFEIPEGDVALNVAGYEIVINSMSLSAAFAPDGSRFEGGSIRGQLDARDLEPLLADQLEGAGPEHVCDLLASFGVACVPCSSDGQPYCAALRVDQLRGDALPMVLEPIAAADCHETCADSCINKECADAATFPVCM